MNQALHSFHQAHKERLARIEARAYRPKPPVAPEPVQAIEVQPSPDLTPMFQVAWSIIEGTNFEGPPPVSAIQRVVAKHYGVSRLDLVSARRTADVVRPRQVAMYLAKKLTSRSLPDIAGRFGGRDHTTALHAVRKIERLRATDPALAAKIDEITGELGVSHATP